MSAQPPEAPLEAACLATITPRAPRWAWRPRVPLGMITMFSGKRGIGKSTLAALLCADASRGRLGGDLEGQPTAVVYVNLEDPAAEATAPRLIAAGADLKRVHLLDAAQAPMLPDDAERLGELVKQTEARLLVIDPLTAALSGAVDAHRDADVRRAFLPLARLAEEQDVAVVGVMHPRKMRADDPMDELSGSAAFGNFPRSVLLAAWDPTAPEGTHRRVLVHAKSSLAPEAPTLEWHVEPATVGDNIPTSRCQLGAESEVTKDDLTPKRTPRDKAPERDEAVAFLRERLGDGQWHPRPDLLNGAAERGISERTFVRAAGTLEIEKRDTDTFPQRSEWRIARPGGATDLGATGAQTLARQGGAQNPLARAENNSAASTANLNNNLGGTESTAVVPPRSAPPRAHTREGSLLFFPAGDGEPEAVEGGTDVERAYLASAPALQRPATEAEEAEAGPETSATEDDPGGYYADLRDRLCAEDKAPKREGLP